MVLVFLAAGAAKRPHAAGRRLFVSSMCLE